ncbi:acyl-CoA dehydrogenase [Hoyosella rhizosphaerae]|nr:acyl-CoA dehydrogenase [Hoyosella rhizosphaerae]MBN4926848.1 acyl-CoA dehydrogenase [Hoyosella rhizosphaerae]
MTKLFNPMEPDFAEFDTRTRECFQATIDFFENHGKAWLKQQDRDRVWYSEFLTMVKKERIFATFLTPASEANGDPDKRWDTARNAMYSKILGFYGMQYWYVWQVSILGLGPIWQSQNTAARKRAADLLEAGEIFAFGLSEKEHGADVYSTDMIVTPQGEGTYSASGGKHYIGNGNLARMVSVFARRSDKPTIDSADIESYKPDEDFEGYLFFAADSQHKNYKLRKNVVDAQMYVAAFDLEDYPVEEEDILHEGKSAFHAAMNTVNIGKFNLGFGAIGQCEHVLYEALTHAENRILFGKRVTEFPQIRRMTAEAYVRLIGMKLYSERAIDYMRSANADDRRYLLFNAIEKMNVTREGEKIIILMADTIAARGFETDMYFPMAMLGAFGLPRLEGTVHVNMALSLKFMPNFLFRPTDAGMAALQMLPVGTAPRGAVRALSTGLRAASNKIVPLAERIPGAPSALRTHPVPDVPHRRDPANDDFLFKQGASRGLSKIAFADWRPVFQKFAHIPNVAVFTQQAEDFQALLVAAKPTAEQQKDVDFLFALGELFTLLPYAQLILEQAEIENTDLDVIDHLFEVFVTDFSSHATKLHCKTTATSAQRKRALDLVREPVGDPARFERIVQAARGLANTYEMKP